MKANQKFDIDELKSPGDIQFAKLSQEEEASGMYYICPCGCSKMGYLPFMGGKYSTNIEPQWNFNKDENCPSITPSILDKRCGYHGYLTNGNFEAC